MDRKIILIALAGIFLGLTSNASAIDRHRNDWRHHFPHPIRPIAFWPPGEIINGPTVESQTVVVWVTNNNGSKTEVELTPAADGGYIGPKGEYYSSMPAEEQLKALYGLPCSAPVRNSVIVYLGKNDGVETVVVLTKDDDGYVGPEGEHYQNMPTVEELRLRY